MPMTVRGGGDPRQAWLARRLREWARRLGASPPMRMTASWSGSASDPPNTSVWRGSVPDGELPSDHQASGIRRRQLEKSPFAADCSCAAKPKEQALEPAGKRDSHD